MGLLDFLFKKKIKIITTIFLLTTSLTLLADTKKEIARCAAIQGDAERVICFDELSKSLGVDKPAVDTEVTDNWTVNKETSPIDDSINVYVRAKAQKPIAGRFNTSWPTLTIRCKEAKTQVYISWNEYLGNDKIKMLTRFDKDEAQTTTWSLSTDNEAVFVRGNNIDYTYKLIQHNKLLVQITPYNSNSMMATFNLQGLEEAIKPLSDACGWSEEIIKEKLLKEEAAELLRAKEQEAAELLRAKERDMLHKIYGEFIEAHRGEKVYIRTKQWFSLNKSTQDMLDNALRVFTVGDDDPLAMNLPTE